MDALSLLEWAKELSSERHPFNNTAASSAITNCSAALSIFSFMNIFARAILPITAVNDLNFSSFINQRYNIGDPETSGETRCYYASSMRRPFQIGGRTFFVSEDQPPSDIVRLRGSMHHEVCLLSEMVSYWNFAFRAQPLPLPPYLLHPGVKLHHFLLDQMS